MNLFYITGARIPAEKAYGTAIMKMCEQIALCGVPLALVAPARTYGPQEDPFTYHGVSKAFSIQRLPATDFVGKRLTISRVLYALDLLSFMWSLARRRFPKDAILYTRDYLLAFVLPRRHLFLELHTVHAHSFLFRKAIQRTRGIVVISNGIRAALIELGVAAERILVAASGVDMKTFDLAISKDEARSKLKLPKDAYLAVYTGNFTTMGQDKGLRDIIVSLKDAPNVTFVAVGGSDNDPANYREIADKEGVSDRVVLLGYAPQSTLALYQKAADVLLMPFPDTHHYRTHMSPVKMFEYMASRRPIIASDLPTIREVLNESNAVIIPPGSPRSIANALNSLQKDPKKGEARARDAYQKVKATYTWKNRAATVIQFINSVGTDSATIETPCTFCGERTMREVIDFGEVALAGAFLKPADFPTEKKYPLRVCFCTQCYAVQVEKKIDPAVLFTNYFYFSSAIGTLRQHFSEYAKEVVGRFLPEPSAATVVEIGCNDGVLMKPIADMGVGTPIGVDPATNVVETINDSRIRIVNDFFGVTTAKRISRQYGKADLILSNNAFAHIEDINGVTSGVASLLKDNGVFIFEVHYLGKILEELQYDMIYHEHLFYYSLIALENHMARHGLVIFDLKPIPIHGGSIRYYACKKGSAYAKNISEHVLRLRAKELEAGYDTYERYRRFADAVADRRRQLMTLVDSLRARGKSIAGYGASGRANTMIQYCGIDGTHLAYVIDDAPAKQGYFTPGSHLEIKSREMLAKEPPDYVLVFAWSFYSEIAAKCEDYLRRGGRMIVPLPEVTVYPAEESL
jgi:methylation protein EvaC